MSAVEVGIEGRVTRIQSLCSNHYVSHHHTCRLEVEAQGSGCVICDGAQFPELMWVAYEMQPQLGKML